MKLIFTTHDEEYDYADRIAEEIGRTLKELYLDTVNKEFVITVDIEEANKE